MRTVFILISFIILFIAGCEHNALFDKNVTSIDVLENLGADKHGEVIHTITDESFIEKLTKELEKAGTSSTANIDMPRPDFWLLFKHDDDIIRKLGYYTEIMNIKYWNGRYIDWEGNKHFGVKIKFPIKEQ